MALLLFIGSLAVANQFQPRERAVGAESLGMDFIAFYTAGTFVREGRLADLYDLDAKRAFQREVAGQIGLEIGDAMGPWWNPPVYAWVFVLFSKLSYPQATGLWVTLNVVCALAAVGLLARYFATRRDFFYADEPIDWRTWGLIPLLALLSMPFIGMVSHAQNTGTSLLLLTITCLLWLSRRALAAGIVCGLLFYKPQLGAIVAGVMVLSLGWRALAGLAITGTGLLLANVLTLPGTLADYLQRLPANLHYAQNELPYLWDRHVTLKAFWRLLLQGEAVGEPAGIVTVLTILGGLALAGGLIIAWSRSGGRSSERLIGATIVSMPLIMPFYFDYDLLLLVVPAVLFARERMTAPASESAGRLDVWLTRAWMALYLWLMINPHVAAATRVNGSVLLLSAVASMSIIRACQRQAQATILVVPGPMALRPAA